MYCGRRGVPRDLRQGRDRLTFHDRLAEIDVALDPLSYKGIGAIRRVAVRMADNRGHCAVTQPAGESNSCRLAENQLRRHYTKGPVGNLWLVGRNHATRTIVL
jgi:hypothetical protein